MTYTITLEAGFVRAVLIDRETVEETREFLTAVARWRRPYPNILIHVRSSKPIFHAMRHVMGRFKEIAQAPGHRIALVADSMEVQASHEYLELLARQQGLNVRSFSSEEEALRWFSGQARDAARSGEQPQTERRRADRERRQQPDRRLGEDRRKQATRRLATRRGGAS
jgi:hypothetical protein